MSLAPVVNKPRIRISSAANLESFQREIRDRRIPALDTESKQAIDAFQNVLGRIGFGTSNLSEGAAYPMTRLSRNYILMNSLYRSNWIARKVIDCIAEDMMKNWINLVTDQTPDKVKDFNRTITRTGTKWKLLEAVKWARLYGGAAAIVMLKGQGDILDKPLDLDSVGPDSYRGLLVLDRWSGISPSATTSANLDDPVQFGLPEHYMVTTERKTFPVHYSRVLRFTGRGLPFWEWLAEQRWGISEFELIFDELRKRDNTSWNLASLIFRANIFSIKFKDLAVNLSGLGKNGAAQQQFYNILQAQNQLMSNQGIIVLPEDGGIETHQYAFGGINEVYESFMLDICGASEIPMSRLFGRTYSGLGQTNIGDEHTYYDIVGQKQQRELDPQLQKLLPIIALSTWGKIPKDFEWFFKPVRSLSNEEQADLATKLSTPVLQAFDTGIITKKEARLELKQISDTTNVFSNLDDKITEEASDELGPAPGEMAEAQLDNLTNPPEEGKEEGAPKVEKPGAKAAKNAKGSKGAKSEPKKSKDSISWPTMDSYAPACEVAFEAERDAKIMSERFQATWDAAFALEGRAEYQGLSISIENDIGSTRRGVSPSGEAWQTLMTWPYGYIQRTEGVDGDHVDCFLGPNPNAELVYVVHTQKRLAGGSFEGYDEDKCMLGWDSEAEAKQAFLENYDDPQHFGSIEPMTMEKFRERLEKKGTKVTAKLLSHDAVDYTKKAKNAKQSCQYCSHFKPASPLVAGAHLVGEKVKGEVAPACELVKPPIAPGGWCKKFKNRHTVDVGDGTHAEWRELRASGAAALERTVETFRKQARASGPDALTASGLDAVPEPSKFKGATIEEQVAALMESRSFSLIEQGADWAVYSRRDHQDPKSGRYCIVFFADGKVLRCECHAGDGKRAFSLDGWEGVFSFTQAHGD